MYKKLLFSSLLIALMFVLLSQAFAGGSSHLVLGTVRTSTAKVPTAANLTITAYITARPGDIMTYPPNNPTKIAYDEPTALWMIEVSGFVGAWVAGETLHIDFQDCGNGEAGSKKVTLNYDPSQNVGQVTLSPIPPVEITNFEPPDGSILDIEPQTVTITFSEAMNTTSVLQNSMFTRKNVTDDVTEMEASICTFLWWFGFTDPASVAKYKEYGCSEPFGIVTPNTVDVTFSGEGGSSVLEITLKDLTVGQPIKPIGPKEYRISITVNEAKGLCGNPLDIKGHVDYTYYLYETASVTNPTVENKITLLNGKVELTIPAGAFDKATNVTVRFLLPSDPALPKFVSLTGKTLTLQGETQPAFVIELDPPVKTPFAHPVTVKLTYTEPGSLEDSIRLYRISEAGDAWEFIPSTGERVDKVNNYQYSQVDTFSTLCLFYSYPYGDLSGNGFLTILDATNVLKLSATLPIAGPFANEDPNFVMATANVSGGDPVLNILDATLILRKSAGIDEKFPVEQTQAAPGLMAIFQSPGIRTAYLNGNSLDNKGVSVFLDDTTGVFGADIELAYDSALLKVSGVSKTQLTSESAMVYDDRKTGKLRILFANALPLNDSGKLLAIQFELMPGADTSCLNSVKLTKFEANAGLIKTRIEPPVPHKLMLLQNYPNPFNPETWIPYRLPQESDVEIGIYNVSGQLIRKLYIGKQTPGSYITKDKAAYWDGTNDNGEKAASGIYFYKLRDGKESIVKKMVILK